MNVINLKTEGTGAEQGVCVCVCVYLTTDEIMHVDCSEEI